MTDWREELIEKMARYIACASSSEDDPTTEWCDENWPAHENQARAALAAAEPVIREQADNALREENARLLAALKPFAEIAESLPHRSNTVTANVLMSDLRAAAAAIREGGKDA